MYLIAITWMYIVLLMAVAEATSPQGTVLGAFFTVLLYGLLPLSVLLYILGTPARKRALRRREAEADAAARAPQSGTSTGAAPSTAADVSASPDGRDHAAGDAVAPKREEP